MRSLSALSARKHQLNHLCAEVVEQQISQHKADNNHHRKRRRYLAKQVLKRVSLEQHRSNRHWLHAVTMVFALWGFNDLVVPNQALAAADFGGELTNFNVEGNAAPTLVDFDGDGDLDAFVGSVDGSVWYFRNDGSNIKPGFVAVTGAGNPLDGFLQYNAAMPALADIDGDGDLDAFVGETYGSVKYYRNTEIDAVAQGTGFVADAGGNPLDGVAVGYYSRAAFADIDGDGDLDAFVGEMGGSVRYYRNTEIDAVAQGTGFVADAGGNPLDGFDVGGEAAPTFADIDGDGDLDAFVGANDGTVNYYRNTEIDASVPGSGFVAVVGADNPLDGFDVGKLAQPTFADIDGDGDLDAFVGEYFGNIRYYRNDGTNLVPNFIAVGAADPLDGFDVGFNSAPALADIDGDGDLDAFVGERGGSVRYYRNTKIDVMVPGSGFVADTAGNPLYGVAVVSFSKLTFADIDGDGDLDAFVGENGGSIKYYRNTEIDTVAQGVGFAADAGGNPLDGIDVGDNATPTFADIDGDGDLDAFVGERVGTVNYYRNTEFDTVAPGTGFIADAAGNPLDGFNVGLFSAPVLADIDGDGDLDAFVGEGQGTIRYYRNTEIDAGADVGFVAVAGADNPLNGFDVGNDATPTLVDIDGDGDLDAFVGTEVGTIKYFQNFDPVPLPVDDSLDAIAGITVSTVDVTTNDEFKIEAPAGTFTITAFDAVTANGATVVDNGDNTFSYTALADFAGDDSFTYTLDDGAGNTAVGKVTVTVSGDVTDSTNSSDDGSSGALNPWSLLLLSVLTLLRRKK